jgi:transposase
MSFCIPTSKKVAAKREIHAVICFSQAEGHSVAEIHHRMSAVYGPNFMSDTYVREWCRKFHDGRTDKHDEVGQGRPSLMTDELKQHIEKLVHKRCRFTTSALSLEFPQVSRMVLYETVTKKTWLPQVSCQMGALMWGYINSCHAMTNA